MHSSSLSLVTLYVCRGGCGGFETQARPFRASLPHTNRHKQQRLTCVFLVVGSNARQGPRVTRVSLWLSAGDNGRISYSIVSGDDEEDFDITSNGTVVTRRTLDRETRSLYNLVVRAEDQAISPQKILSSTVQVTIVIRDVNDNSPEFISSNSTTVAENIPLNTVVMAVKAADRDEGRNSYIEYSLSPDPMFSLGPVDGLLRVTGRLDREVRANYTLWVTARDRGDPPRSTRVAVEVKVTDENDNSPVFDPRQYSASIPENASIGASVLQVSYGRHAVLLRVGELRQIRRSTTGRLVTADTSLYYGQVRYFLKEGDADLFRINASTGEIMLLRSLDREEQAEYLLTLVAMDTGIVLMCQCVLFPRVVDKSSHVLQGPTSPDDDWSCVRMCLKEGHQLYEPLSPETVGTSCNIVTDT
uniref:Cadherin domain-containing protein n=1 Tax=Timema tahoe TaxID=61484 RepID=A0A7R9P159_9NEOP|nr:unnamed protein product [Timema tahoe]